MINYQNYMISSIRIAQLSKTSHKTVMKNIQKLLNNFPMSLGLNPNSYFVVSRYQDKDGKSHKCYQVTPWGQDVYKLYDNTSNIFTFVAKYQQLKHTELANDTTLSVPSYSINDGIKRAKQWIREQAHLRKVQRQFNYIQNAGTLSTGELAQDYSKTAHWLNGILAKLGVQYYQSGHWNLTSKYKTLGKFVSFYDDKHKMHLYLKWYPTARVVIHKILAQHHINTLSKIISSTSNKSHQVQHPINKAKVNKQKQDKKNKRVEKQTKREKQSKQRKSLTKEKKHARANKKKREWYYNHKELCNARRRKNYLKHKAQRKQYDHQRYLKNKANKEKQSKTKQDKKPHLTKTQIKNARYAEWEKHPEKLSKRQKLSLRQHRWYLRNRKHVINRVKKRNKLNRQHKNKQEAVNNKKDWRDDDDPF